MIRLLMSLLGLLLRSPGRGATPPGDPGAARAPDGGVAQQEDDAESGAAGQELDPGIRHRIAVLVRVPERPAHQRLALRIFRENDWPAARLPREQDPAAGKDWVSYVVEVRQREVRRGARADAERRVREAAGRLLPLRIVESALLDPRFNEPSSTWHLYRKPSWGARRRLRWLAEVWVNAGGADVGRAVTLPGEPQKADVIAEFARRDLGGVVRDPRIHGIRRTMGPRIDASDDPAHGWWHRWRGAALRMLTGLCAMLCGAALYAVPVAVRVAPAVLLAVGSWFFGRWMTGNAARPWIVRWSAGAFVLGGSAAIGFMWAMQAAEGLVSQLSGVGLAAMLWFTVYGCWYALRGTWLSRNAVGLLSVLVLPLPFVLPGVGRFLQSLYVNDTFAIPTAVVPLEPFWLYVIALKPVAFCAATLLFVLAICGWLRHWYWSGSGKPLTVAMMAVVGVLYLLTSLLVGAQQTNAAAQRAAADAIAGHTPKSYFGIQGTLVCVRPLVGHPSVQNGPLPSGRPLLSFGTVGDQLWLWDPERADGKTGVKPSMQVRTEQVSTYPAEGAGGRTCRGKG